MQVSEKLQCDLQVKKNRVLSSTSTSVTSELVIFFEFVNKNSILAHAIDELRNNLPSFDEWFSRMTDRHGIVWPNTESERLKLCLVFLERTINETKETNEPWNIGLRVSPNKTRNLTDLSTFFLEQFFMPLYEYLDSKIEEQSVVLHTLQRFKFKSEWFKKESLFMKYKEKKKERKGEEFLDLRLREYLFDQGIDYPFSQAESPSGRADVLSQLETNDPLVLEVKIFDPEMGYDKPYIKQGLVQCVKYCNDFNKDVGYLVVFNPSKADLRFKINENENPARVLVDGKKIFLISVDILPERLSASKKSDTVEIKEDDLLSIR